MDDGLVIVIAIGALMLFGGAGVYALTGKLSLSQIATVARNAGFSGNDLVTAIAIAMAESSGNPNAIGDAGIGEGSFGLWQINSYYHPEYGPDFTTLYDPQVNANAAYAIYVQSGRSFKPWSTFNSGAFASYLPDVNATLTA
jgi:hypothetical protein